MRSSRAVGTSSCHSGEVVGITGVTGSFDLSGGVLIASLDQWNGVILGNVLVKLLSVVYPILELDLVAWVCYFKPSPSTGSFHCSVGSHLH